MGRRLKKISCLNAGAIIVSALCAMTMPACDSLDDNRIPAMNVQIVLNNPGLWNTYGVSGYGQYNEFIRQTRQPANFFFTETTYTGFGGVLLVMGMDPFSAGDVVPLAYDLACPVECKEYIRVVYDTDRLDARCPICGSRYDVLMSGGAPTAGPALTGSVKYGLQRYTVNPSGGGYVIAR